MTRARLRPGRALAAILVAMLAAPGDAAAHGASGSGHQGAASEDFDGEELVLDLAGGGEAETWQLVRGRHYRLTVRSDVPVELHLHGFDLHADAVPDAPAVFEFVTGHTGRFSLEAHGGDDLLGRDEVPVLFLEVRPD